MGRTIVLSPDSFRQFKKLNARDRSRLREALLASLSEDDAPVETLHRFHLRRPSEYADFELRVEDMRVFYRVAGDEGRVVLIGRKKGGHLLVDGRRFTL
jgi:mRNA-degrading endonuclease RelE of RelBE toxin-antitoxin system